MAIAFDASSYASGEETNSISWTHTCTGSNLLLIVGTGNMFPRDCTGVNHDTGGTPTAMTEKWAVIDDDAGEHKSQGWSLVNPATGANKGITASFDDNFYSAGCGACSFTGVDQSTPLGTADTAGTDSTEAEVNPASASGDLCVDFIHCQGEFLDVSGGQTERWVDRDPTGWGASAGMSTEAGAAPTVEMKWDFNTNAVDWAYGGISIKPVAAAAAAPTGALDGPLVGCLGGPIGN